MNESNPRNPGKVLVMDDDQMVRATARLMLQRLGFDVELAADGQEAIAIYQRQLASDYPVDVVILDLKVPGAMGAAEAAARILALDPDAKLVVASGSANDPVMVEYAANGFCGRIAKPFLVAQVGMVVGELLD